MEHVTVEFLLAGLGLVLGLGAIVIAGEANKRVKSLGEQVVGAHMSRLVKSMEQVRGDVDMLKAQVDTIDEKVKALQGMQATDSETMAALRREVASAQALAESASAKAASAPATVTPPRRVA